jgi:hypothetical protein
MDENNVANVSTGKPMATGAVFVASKDTAVPTDASTPLGANYRNMGYISEEGVTQGIEEDINSIKAWGGDKVLNTRTGFAETYKLKFIENKADVLKEYWGADNVTEGEGSELAVIHSSAELTEHPWVIEVLMAGDIIRRIVIPRGQVKERGEVVFVDEEAIGYEMTISAYATTIDGKAGATSAEYFAKIEPGENDGE